MWKSILWSEIIDGGVTTWKSFHRREEGVRVEKAKLKGGDGGEGSQWVTEIKGIVGREGGGTWGPEERDQLEDLASGERRGEDTTVNLEEGRIFSSRRGV